MINTIYNFFGNHWVLSKRSRDEYAFIFDSREFRSKTALGLLNMLRAYIDKSCGVAYNKKALGKYPIHIDAKKSKNKS